MRKRVWFLTFVIAGWSMSIGRADDLLPPDQEVSAVVDHYIDARLTEAGVTSAAQADDSNLIRRITLDLVGRIPTVAETKAFVESSDTDKRAKLVDRLIASPAFVRHQADEFDTLLMYTASGSVRDYLLNAFGENRSWDQMFRELVLGEEADNEQKGAIQFVKSRASDLDKLANEASVTFFGVNVSCAQCHDHPLVPQWTQEHFFGMKSFFSRTFDNGGLVGERDYGIVKYKTTDGEERSAKLMFLTGTVVDEPEPKEPSDKEKQEEKKRLEELKKNKQPPPPPQFSRRSQLIDVALRDGENRYFARSIANRIWYRMFGYGLVMPLDQMHPENKPSHPELLDWLARDLIAHNYDLRRLTRGLVLSQAYSRSSFWDSAERPPEKLFAVANVRPLTPRQYSNLLRFATTNPDTLSAEMSPDEFEKRVESIENSARGLAASFDQPDADFQVSVTEALLLSNDERIKRDLLRDAGDSLIGKLKTIEDRREAIELAVQSVFNRSPDDEEVKLLESFLAGRDDRNELALAQMVWALLTSSECRFNY